MLCIFRGWEKNPDVPDRNDKYTPVACLRCNLRKNGCVGGIRAEPPEGKTGKDCLPKLAVRQATMEDLIARGMITRERRDSWFQPDGKSLRSRCRT